MDNHDSKPTRTLTFWILFLGVEQFRTFRAGHSPGANPADAFPGVSCPDVAASLTAKGLVDRQLGSTGTGARNTIRQHLVHLVHLGLMYNRPGEPNVFVPTPRAENLYTAVAAEGYLDYFMCRDSFRKLPELALFALLRRTYMPKGEWNVSNLARASAIGDLDRLRDALKHIGNYIEVRKGGNMERVRLRTKSAGPTSIQVQAEDQVVRDSSSSCMDQLDSVAQQDAQGPAGPQGVQGIPGAAGPQETQSPQGIETPGTTAGAAADAPFEPLGDATPPSTDQAAPAAQVDAPESVPAAEETPPSPRVVGTWRAEFHPAPGSCPEGESPTQQAQDRAGELGANLAEAVSDLQRRASRGQSKAVSRVLSSLGSLLYNLAQIVDPPR